jgi:hypothetical protein
MDTCIYSQERKKKSNIKYTIEENKKDNKLYYKNWIVIHDYRNILCKSILYEVCSKSSRNLSINIFLYSELTEYYPLQNSPLAQQCTSSTALSTSGSTVRRICGIAFKSFVALVMMSSTV